MKKALKIFGIFLLVVVVLLIAAPFLFQGTIERSVKKAINKNLNATVEWEDLNLSLFRNFPDAQLRLENVQVLNKTPFEGDTLVDSESLWLNMGIMQLFKSSESLQIDEFGVENGYFNIKVDSLGNANYDIAKKQEQQADSESESDTELALNIQHYEINNTRINYLDESSKTFLRIRDFNHEGNGDFSADTSTLETTTKAIVSFALDGTDYLENHSLQLDADFEMDLENMQFTFLENEALINQLPLTFDGFVKINDDNNEIDLTFQTPSSDFKNFLAVIPKEYAKNLDGVNTSGDFSVNGSINGIVDDTYIPKMDIRVVSENAAFQYPDLPKGVQNIYMDAVLKNESGLMKDTYLNINRLSFKIDEDAFSANGSLKNLTENMLVDMTAKGTLNLANIEKAYPVELDQDLNGILQADLTTSFDMNSLDQGKYQNIKSSGTASITNFNYDSPDMANPVAINSARLSFKPGSIQLEDFQAKTGQTDAKISGQIDNLMGFMFADQVLKGRFNMQSNTFSVNDFMVAAPEENTSKKKNQELQSSNKKEEAIKIPAFLDARLDFTAGKVLYDNLTLTNAKGTVLIKNETATLENITSDIFGGGIALSGNVSTKQATPTFMMDLDLKNISIAKSYDGLELFQGLVPIAKALEGNLNTTLKLNGNLNNDLTPVLASLAGNAAAQVLNAEVNPNEAPLVAKLDNQLQFLDLDKLNLKNLKTNLTFNNGNIEVKPFTYKVEDITITAGGNHSLENVMDYTITLDLPAKYLGDEIGSNLAKLTKSDLETMMVEVPVGLSGTFTNPKINVNTKDAVKELTNKIIDNQKDDLLEKGKDKVRDILGDDDDEATKDGTKKEDKEKSDEEKIKDAAKDAFDGIFGKKGDKKGGR